MPNYSKITNFAAKDALASGNPLKIVTGTGIDNEFNAIAVAIATKADATNAVLITPNIGAATGASLALTGNETVGGNLTVTGNESIGGTLGVTGVTTLSSLNVTGNESISGALSVTGVITASGGINGNLNGNATTATTANNASYATTAGSAVDATARATASSALSRANRSVLEDVGVSGIGCFMYVPFVVNAVASGATCDGSNLNVSYDFTPVYLVGTWRNVQPNTITAGAKGMFQRII